MTGSFSDLPTQPPDFIIQLMAQFREDPRPDKVDLGVGIYRNAAGKTPIMRAVKAAEAQLFEQETTKSYVALEGDTGFHAAMARLILGQDAPMPRIAAAATVGGTGALNIGLQLIRRARPNARIWVPSPTWANHSVMIPYQGFELREYAYFDTASRSVDFDAMQHSLKDVGPEDVVILHGCCHNPTGADLGLQQWNTVAQILREKGALPMIDLAYQGFGAGIEADARPTRLMVENCPEVLIAASCSKNFGLYRERAGVLLAVGDKSARANVQGNLSNLNRMTYSFPPDHGARLATMVLTSAELRADWIQELDEIRTGMISLRQQLSAELQRLTNTDRFAFLTQHRGMFSQLGASPDQVAQMRAEHGIYMLGDSRINVAGLTAKTVPVVAQAMVSAGL